MTSANKTPEGDTMIQYERNGRGERHAAFPRTLAFLWVLASEGDEIRILDPYLPVGYSA